MGCTRTRTGKLTELAREMAAVPASAVAGVKPEVRELVEEVIKGDAGFGKSWAEYVIGMEQRQVELMTGMTQANTVLLESAVDAYRRPNYNPPSRDDPANLPDYNALRPRTFPHVR